MDYDSLSPNHQKLVVDHVQHLKDNNDKRWENFNYIHPHMNITNIEKVKLNINNSHKTINQIEHNLSDKEIQEHIHPLINHIIDVKPQLHHYYHHMSM